jgi:hypothetical protein
MTDDFCAIGSFQGNLAPLGKFEASGFTPPSAISAAGRHEFLQIQEMNRWETKGLEVRLPTCWGFVGSLFPGYAPDG